MKNVFTLTYLNHALLSHISALGAHRETNMESIGNIDLIFDLIDKKLEKASQPGIKQEDNLSAELSKLLLSLQEQIKQSEPGLKRQQLRLFYNISASTSKIMDEMRESGIDG